MKKFSFGPSFFVWALVFLIIGVSSRFLLHNKVESRFIIAAAWMVALALEYLLRPLFDLRPRNKAFLLNGIAATVGIVATKWSLEGLPYYLY